MADTQRDKDDFVNAATGLFKTNLAKELVAARLRDFTESMHLSYGSMYVSSSLETVIATVNVFVGALGTTAKTSTNRFSMGSSNRLTYDGVADIVALLFGSVSFAGAASDKELGAGLYKWDDSLGTGSVLDSTKQRKHAKVLAELETVSFAAFTPLSTDDYIELHVANHTDNTNLTVHHADVLVLGLFK